MKSFHIMKRRGKPNRKGRRVWSIGFKVGYFPCLEGPFIEVLFATSRVTFWFGLPSYKLDNFEKLVRGQRVKKAVRKVLGIKESSK